MVLMASFPSIVGHEVGRTFIYAACAVGPLATNVPNRLARISPNSEGNTPMFNFVFLSTRLFKGM
jgi:hypothetical protein